MSNVCLILQCLLSSIHCKQVLMHCYKYIYSTVGLKCSKSEIGFVILNLTWKISICRNIMNYIDKKYVCIYLNNTMMPINVIFFI